MTLTRIWNAIRPALERAGVSALQVGLPALLAAGVGAINAGALTAAGFAGGAAAITVLFNAVVAWRTDDLWLRRLKTALEAGGSVLVTAGTGWWNTTVLDAAVTAAVLAGIAALTVRDTKS